MLYVPGTLNASEESRRHITEKSQGKVKDGPFTLHLPRRDDRSVSASITRVSACDTAGLRKDSISVPSRLAMVSEVSTAEDRQC